MKRPKYTTLAALLALSLGASAPQAAATPRVFTPSSSAAAPAQVRSLDEPCIIDGQILDEFGCCVLADLCDDDCLGGAAAEGWGLLIPRSSRPS